ncbi:MAG: hypothetical protein OEY23_06405 [Acidimicrobiia bacterium]|nr:hypothetical protein [Acidimicrobiia bacterium]
MGSHHDDRHHDEATETLAWARREVLDLLDLAVVAETDEDFDRYSETLQALVAATADTSRRLSILVQMTVAITALVEHNSARVSDRSRRDALDTMRRQLRACVHVPPPPHHSLCRRR